ncbi:hypothetical protein K491DRAFT_679160 [Lophiostoma macrostomum CBS 122681]|uniref:Uncharacterized protein n=1 Tax=Lophiostoma macrostomum CBS 122681 TaxID=1314788 RepID=A0A6A6T5W5_9PLEO|nr:hypothetical protein K491DRAFT_679160 [Lophiostoma macrostomum CBS 122681]
MSRRSQFGSQFGGPGFGGPGFGGNAFNEMGDGLMGGPTMSGQGGGNPMMGMGSQGPGRRGMSQHGMMGDPRMNFDELLGRGSMRAASSDEEIARETVRRIRQMREFVRRGGGRGRGRGGHRREYHCSLGSDADWIPRSPARFPRR